MIKLSAIYIVLFQRAKLQFIVENKVTKNEMIRTKKELKNVNTKRIQEQQKSGTRAIVDVR